MKMFYEKNKQTKGPKKAFFPLPRKCHFGTRPIPLSKIGGNAICARFLHLYRQNRYGDLQFLFHDFNKNSASFQRKKKKLA